MADTARKAMPHRSVPATAARSAPDTTGAIPAKARAAEGDDEVLPPPFALPKVARTRMRACGRKWEAMKQVGATRDEIWRDFATKCLAAKADPVLGPTIAGGAGGGPAYSP